MVGGAAAGNKIKSQKQIGIIITDVYVTLVMELITQHGPVLLLLLLPRKYHKFIHPLPFNNSIPLQNRITIPYQTPRNDKQFYRT